MAPSALMTPSIEREKVRGREEREERKRRKRRKERKEGGEREEQEGKEGRRKEMCEAYELRHACPMFHQHAVFLPHQEQGNRRDTQLDF